MDLLLLFGSVQELGVVFALFVDLYGRDIQPFEVDTEVFGQLGSEAFLEVGVDIFDLTLDLEYRYIELGRAVGDVVFGHAFDHCADLFAEADEVEVDESVEPDELVDIGEVEGQGSANGYGHGEVGESRVCHIEVRHAELDLVVGL